jgi:aspartyl-tRNA(Asn)/glutamyl-tRNA(Gln) amidotransferase subunit A
MTAPFNVTGGPALVQCIGFSAGGLPLSMQVVGKPFDEPAVFQVAHAYEQATAWRRRRPELKPGAVARPIAPTPIPNEAKSVDAETRALVAQLAIRAGLKLPDHLLVQLCEAAPFALAMAQRIRRRRERSDEPANVFRFPGHG